jgi:hypothetical protein
MNQKTSNPLDETQTKKLIESILPETHVRGIGLSILADGIVESNFHRRENWAVTNNDPDSIWFQVGHYAALTLERNGIWLALDKQLIEIPLTDIAFLSKNEFGWSPDRKGLFQFKDKHKPGKPISINGYYVPVSYKSHIEIWPFMRRLFFEFIFKANYIGQPMLTPTKKLHNSCILAYLRNELGKNIPDPLYDE